MGVDSVESHCRCCHGVRALDVFPGNVMEVDEQWSEGGDGRGRDADGRLDHGPLHQIDSEPGVIILQLELADVHDADYRRGACTNSR